MPEYMINDIPVNFPFEPYDVQKVFMEKVIESLKTSTNAVLESPTGTGKTLSLLCSSLAWVLSKKAEVSDIGTNKLLNSCRGYRRFKLKCRRMVSPTH